VVVINLATTPHYEDIEVYALPVALRIENGEQDLH